MSDHLNDWNPMEEDYYDPNRNSYDTGAGANLPKHLQPAVYKKGENNIFKIYVYPLNARFNTLSIRNLFSEFGEVHDVYVEATKQNWAFVYYKSQEAANKAISSMNDHPDFKFKVSYAREKEKSLDTTKKVDQPNAIMNGFKNEIEGNVEKNVNVSENQKYLNNTPSRASHEIPTFAFSQNLFPSESKYDSENSRKSMTNQSLLKNKPKQIETTSPCYYCQHGTKYFCQNCDTSFCSTVCSIRGYEGHPKCIQVAPVISGRKPIENTSRHFSNGAVPIPKDYMDFSRDPQNGSEESLLRNFSDTTADYVTNSYQGSAVSATEISNSYDDLNLENSCQTEQNIDRNLDTTDGDKIKKTQNSEGKSDPDSNFHNDVDSKHHSVSKSLPVKTDINEKSARRENGFRDSNVGQKKPSSNGISKNDVSRNDQDDSCVKFRDIRKNRVSFNKDNNANRSDLRKESSPSYETNRNSKSESSAVPTHTRHLSRNDSGDSKRLPKNRSSISEQSSSSRNLNPLNHNSNSYEDFVHAHDSYNSTEISTKCSRRIVWLKNEKIEVTLNEIEPATVLIPQEKEILTEICTEINSESVTAMLSPLKSLEVKNKCLAMHKGCWYRALIESTSPLKVRFVDMSVKLFECNEHELMEVPEKFYNIPPFCYNVKFLNVTNDDLKQIKASKKPFEIMLIEKDSTKTWSVKMVQSSPEKKSELVGKINDFGTQRNERKPSPRSENNERRFPERRDRSSPRNDNYEQKSFGTKKERSSPKKEENEQISPIVDQSEKPSSPVNLSINLKQDVPFEMTVTTIRNETSFFVTDYIKAQKLFEMIKNENVDSLPPLRNAVDGSMCLAPFGNDWFRAKIVSMNPLKVAFIDFGNAEECELEDLKTLPDKYFKIKDLAILVRLERGTVSDHNVTDEKSITIIPTHFDLKEKVWIVRIKGSKFESEIIKNVMVVYSVSKTELFVTDIGKKSEYDAILSTDESTFIDKYVKTPEIGSLYFVNFDGLWSRAKVTKTAPLTVLFVDFGNENVVNLEELRILPEKWICVPPLAFKIVLKSELSCEIDVPDELKISKESDNYWKIIQINNKNLDPHVEIMEKGSSARESPLKREVKNEAVVIQQITLKNMPSDKIDEVVKKPRMNDVSSEKASPPKTQNSMEELIAIVPPIEIGDVVEVIVMTVTDTGDYAVIPADRIWLYKKIMLQLEECVPTLSKITKLRKDDFCVVILDGLAYRAKIISDNPVVVFFIDLGWEDLVDPSTLRSIPKHLAKIDPLGFRIALEDEKLLLDEKDEVMIEIMDELEDHYFFVKLTPKKGPKKDKSNSEVQVKTKSVRDHPQVSEPVSKFDDLNLREQTRSNISDAYKKPLVPAKVLLSDENLSTSADDTRCVETFDHEYVDSIPSLPATKSIFDELSAGSEGVFAVSKMYTSTRFSGLIMPQHSIHKNMFVELDKLVPEPKYKPKIGELIATKPQNSENWMRGYVLYGPNNFNQNYTVSTIDKAEIVYADKIAPLPKKFQEVPSFAFSCEITSFPKNKTTLKPKLYKYQISSCSFFKRTTEGILWKPRKEKSKETCYKVKFKPWTPYIDEIGIHYVKVKNGDRVKITCMNSSNKYSIVLADDDNCERRMEIMDAVMKYYIHAESVTQELFIGEVVGVLWEDTFYRAQVINKEDDLYLVHLLDQGTEFEVPVTSIRIIPKELKERHCTAVTVTLKDIPITDINFQTEKYLKYIIEQGKEFELVIDDSSTVVLQCFKDQDYSMKHTKNDKILTLNDYLQFLLIPEWMKPEDLQFEFKEKYVDELVKYDSYEVGTKLKLYLVSTNSVFGNVIMINKRGKAWKKLLEVNLSERLRIYSESKKESYVPSANELCIAKYEDQWCRAMCLETNPGKAVFLFLIDHGFMTHCWHTEIRRMVPEFLAYTATALICDISDHDLDTTKYDVHSLEGKEISDCVIVKCRKLPEYDIAVKNLVKFFN